MEEWKVLNMTNQILSATARQRRNNENRFHILTLES